MCKKLTEKKGESAPFQNKEAAIEGLMYRAPKDKPPADSALWRSWCC